MQNKLSPVILSLCSQAEDMAVGCHNLQVTLGIEHNTETVIRGVLTPAGTAENTYQAAKAAKSVAVAAQKSADVSAREFITMTVTVLKKHLGKTWSPLWAEVGFVNGSLAVPSKISQRLGLLLSIKTYLAAHTGYEADQVAVTADAAEDRRTILQNAHNTVNACRADTGVKKGLRNTAVKNLRKKMRGLILELTDVLPGDDARWHSFGLNMPDAVGIADVPEDLVVTGGGPGHLLAVWGSAALADRYNVYRKITGVDADFVLVKTTTETEADLNTMTSGQIVRVRVSSVNDAGESLLSDPVERVVP